MIIGIGGALRAGKDTVAARLCEDWGFRRIAFADCLRQELTSRLPRTLQALHDLHCRCKNPGHVEDMLYVSKPPGFRELLQEYGTDVRRQDCPTYWTDRWRERVAAATQHIVVPDVRFPNEAQAILDMGGKLWRVSRPDRGRRSLTSHILRAIRTLWRRSSDDAGAHQSETALDGWDRWDVMLQNDADVDGLWAQVDALMGKEQR